MRSSRLQTRVTESISQIHTVFGAPGQQTSLLSGSQTGLSSSPPSVLTTIQHMAPTLSPHSHSAYGSNTQLKAPHPVSCSCQKPGNLPGIPWPPPYPGITKPVDSTSSILSPGTCYSKCGPAASAPDSHPSPDLQTKICTLTTSPDNSYEH